MQNLGVDIAYQQNIALKNVDIQNATLKNADNQNVALKKDDSQNVTLKNVHIHFQSLCFVDMHSQFDTDQPSSPLDTLTFYHLSTYFTRWNLMFIGRLTLS